MATETTETPAAEEPTTETDAAAAAESSADAEPGLDIGSQSEVEVLIEGPQPEPLIRGKVDQEGVAIGTGRRKTAVARVRIKDGDGKLTINDRELEEYFTLERDRQMIQAPLKATGMAGQVDVWVRVGGGGSTGQAGAVVLGIARALEAKEHELHTTLSEGGYLTRDGRMVERKKYGYRKARRSFQFSKR